MKTSGETDLTSSGLVRLTLPDRSQVDLDRHTLKFYCAGSPDRAIASIDSSTKNCLSEIDFELFAKWLQYPHRQFGDCFARVSDHPRYSPKRSTHDFDVRFLTRLYRFSGNYRGGTFSSSDTEWCFLDGGIIYHNGYGWGSHSWTVIQGAEALRAVCMFFGIRQPASIRGEGRRRPLSMLLEEMTKAGRYSGDVPLFPTSNSADRKVRASASSPSTGQPVNPKSSEHDVALPGPPKPLKLGPTPGPEARPMNKRLLYETIRDEVTKAAKSELRKGAFHLHGRGHEPRVTLDRQMAGILRACKIPRVTISGFGANNFYPARIFLMAKGFLVNRLGWCPFEISRDACVYLVNLSVTNDGATND
jgi:hypothetical protein